MNTALVVVDAWNTSKSSLHKDWMDNYGNSLMEGCKFSYKNVDFSEIAKASRKK